MLMLENLKKKICNKILNSHLKEPEKSKSKVSRRKEIIKSRGIFKKLMEKIN